MSTSNVVIINLARESLRGKWGLAIGTFVVYYLLVGVPGSMEHIGWLFSIFLAGPFALGISVFALSISRGKEARLEQMFDGFRYYWKTVGSYMLLVIYIFLWTLLFIIPGIIAAFSYSMTFYILADDPSLKPQEALDKSRMMMDGYKWKLFNLYLRFFGLALLCILTLGIGFLWLIPFVNVALATFYDDLRTSEAI
jgi:uncharacterized membrane protein